MRAVRFVLGAAALLGACGDDGYTIVPWDEGGPCWPIEAQPGGDVEVGTGDIDFVPMPEMLLIHRNTTQSDPYLEVHSRMRGMPPGDPFDFLAPENPRTKTTVVIEELGLTLGVQCPASIGYIPAPGAKGAYDLSQGLRVGFGTFPVEQAAGKQARITLEIVGANRAYASDEKTATLTLSTP